jgi:hypothetical protein
MKIGIRYVVNLYYGRSIVDSWNFTVIWDPHTRLKIGLCIVVIVLFSNEDILLFGFSFTKEKIS